MVSGLDDHIDPAMFYGWRAKQLLDRLPKDQPPRGIKPNWGSERDAAYAIAARLGHHFDPKCQSCDADVMDVLIQAAK